MQIEVQQDLERNWMWLRRLRCADLLYLSRGLKSFFPRGDKSPQSKQVHIKQWFPRNFRISTNASSLGPPMSPQVSSPLTVQPARTPTTATKRLRVETLDATLRGHEKRYHHHHRRSPTKMSPAVRTGSDVEDVAIVPTADPGPSSGSLLRERPSPTTSSHRKVTFLTESPIDFSSPHIPPMQPLINRQTLRELDLDIILRNPVLRHDLLFDPGLQFRPRRKHEMSEKYWNALWEEVQSGCTCVTLDVDGKSHKTVCICARHPETPTIPIMTPISHSVYSLRLPSRIPAFLTEFLEGMLFVIQPLSNAAVYTNRNAVKKQAQEHSAHAAHLREMFDPALIHQEIKHKVFDPSGLFTHIGETLKYHCAPTRDQTVEEMVQFAQQPGIEAFKAFRTCLELLELMKLDIANHQLTQLRPWLLRNTGVFKIKAFKLRFGVDSSLRHTREWLHKAHDSLLARGNPIPHPLYPAQLDYQSLTKNQQIFLATLKGVTDLIFDASSISPHSLPTSSPSSSPPTTTPSLFSSRPETLYLDTSRLSHLSSEAVDTTTMYMLTLFFHLLAECKVSIKDVMLLKQEIRDIGPSRLGSCLVSSFSADEDEDDRKELEERRNHKQDLVLQIARRASELRSLDTEQQHPDARTLCVAERWAETNMQPGSTLSTLLHNRVRKAVFEVVVSFAYPGRYTVAAHGPMVSLTADLTTASASLGPTTTVLSVPRGATTMTSRLSTLRMEPVVDEVHVLAEKIARLALIHLNTYLPMYEAPGFFSTL